MGLKQTRPEVAGKDRAGMEWDRLWLAVKRTGQGKKNRWSSKPANLKGTKPAMFWRQGQK